MADLSDGVGRASGKYHVDSPPLLTPRGHVTRPIQPFSASPASPASSASSAFSAIGIDQRRLSHDGREEAVQRKMERRPRRRGGVDKVSADRVAARRGRYRADEPGGADEALGVLLISHDDVGELPRVHGTHADRDCELLERRALEDDQGANFLIACA